MAARPAISIALHSPHRRLSNCQFQNPHIDVLHSYANMPNAILLLITLYTLESGAWLIGYPAVARLYPSCVTV